MSVPKKKRTKGSVRQRRSHHALKGITLSVCPKCGKAVKPHTACEFCGNYKGREVIKVAAPKSVKDKK